MKIAIKSFFLMLSFLLMSNVVGAQIDNENNFYKEIKGKGLVKNLVKDYGLKSNFDPSTSSVLQKAVDEVSAKGGGTINIPKGSYLLSPTALKSNVHIVIDKAAIIRLKTEGKNTTLFMFGEKNRPTVSNVSITCSDKSKRYIVDFENSGDMPAFAQMGNVENFLISGFEVKDNFTKFSSIRMGISEYNGNYFYPTNGIIKNCSTINSHYGYGLIQSQACKNVLFKDLSGIGGATLRLETGAKNVNDLQIGGNFGVVARNISCINGNSSIMVSPHAMQNGTVDIDGVYGENCGFVLRIENGFIATKYNADSKIKVGSYEKVTAKNIKGVYGTEAQLKSKHFKFMPCELHSKIRLSLDNENREALADVPVYIGPAIAVVMDTEDFPTEISKVEAIGFITQPIVKESDVYVCGDEKKYEVKKAGTKQVKGEKKVKGEKTEKVAKVKNSEAKADKIKNKN